MPPAPLFPTYCLEHQLTEDYASPRGLVCERCHARLKRSPPQGTCQSYWESQPAVYTLQREPCWVFTLRWEDFQIRSLHWNGEQGVPAEVMSPSLAGERGND
jgi:hypothetical protein